MIAKIGHAETIQNPLYYNEKKVSKGHATVIGSCNIDYDIENKQHPDLDDVFDALDARVKKGKTKEPIITISLNPHSDDLPKLDDEKLLVMAEEYLYDMGYKNQPYIIYKHEDIERTHIHIVTTSLDENGKKITKINKHGKEVDNCKFDYYDSQEATKKLEKKYSLTPAYLTKEDDKYVWKHSPKKVTADKDVSRQIKDVIRYCKQRYRYSSIGEFTALMETFNVGCEVRYDDDRHIKGITFFVTDDNNNRISNGIESSFLGSKYNGNAIQKSFSFSIKLNKWLNKKTKERLQPIIQAYMEDVKAITASSNDDDIENKKQGVLDKFKENLNQNDFQAVFRYNKSGGLQGVTFIDNKENNIANGSALDRGWSAKLFNTIIKSEKQKNEHEQGTVVQSLPQALQPQIETINVSEDSGKMVDIDVIEQIYYEQYGYEGEIFRTIGHIENENWNKEDLPNQVKYKKKKKKKKKIYKL